MPSPEDIKLAYESGKLDEWMDSGAITPEKYEHYVTQYHGMQDDQRAASLGVPAQPPRSSAGGKPKQPAAPAEPDVVANIPMSAPPIQIPAYTPDEELARPSSYVPGHGGADAVDGDVWDQIKAKIPHEIRDATLLPSHGPVWFEPSDEEAEAAIGDLDAVVSKQAGHEEQWKGDPMMRRSLRANMVQAWKDEQWAKVYDAAAKRGEAIYRARDINDESPGFMKTAKRMAEYMAPLEGAYRGAEETIALGIPSAIIDDTHRDYLQMQAEVAGVPFDEEAYQAEAQDQLAREQRVLERAPFAKTAGSIAGALVPQGAASRLAGYASKLLGANVARGAGNAAVREAVASGGSAFTEQMAAQGVQGQRMESAGLEAPGLGEMAQSAAMTAGVAGVLGGTLAIPGGVSRKLRNAGDADASAHAALGPDSTTQGNWSGIREPEALRDIAPDPVGREAVIRQRAAEAGADELLMSMPPEAGRIVTRDARSVAAGVMSDAGKAQTAVDDAAVDLVARGEALDVQIERDANMLAENVMQRANKRLKEGPLERQAATNRALRKEGAPDYSELPGPNNMYSDIALERQGQEALDDGLETDYPSVSSAPIIDRHNKLVQMMSFADDTQIPNTSAQKFKKAVDSLFRKKVVSPEEASDYVGVAYDIRTVEDEAGEEMAEVLLPRRLSARELDDFIKNTDEMSKFPNSPQPEAARFREIGQAAAELRDTSFRTLAATKQKQHLEMLKDEEMLRALGLPPNLDKMDPGNAEVATVVAKRIKEMASTAEEITPSTLATHHKQFAKWLSTYDEPLYDQYMDLRAAYRQKRPMNEFNVSATNQPLSSVESIQKVADAITGDDRKYQAMLDSFGSTPAATKLARQEHARTSGLMKLLGADLSNRPEVEQLKIQRRLQQALVDGGDDFAILREAVKPEQRAVLDVARKAAQDTEGVFTTLGFAKGKWKTADRRDIINGLHDVFSSYKAFGSKDEMNRAIDEVFERSPRTKEALKLLKQEKAFQHLMRSNKDDAKVVAKMSGIGGYFVSSRDFFINHLDAMMGSGQTGKVRGVATPVGNPTPYAVGIASPVLSDADRKDPRLSKIPGEELLNMLFQAYERAVKEP